LSSLYDFPLESQWITVAIGTSSASSSLYSQHTFSAGDEITRELNDAFRNSSMVRKKLKHVSIATVLSDKGGDPRVSPFRQYDGSVRASVEIKANELDRNDFESVKRGIAGPVLELLVRILNRQQVASDRFLSVLEKEIFWRKTVQKLCLEDCSTDVEPEGFVTMSEQTFWRLIEESRHELETIGEQSEKLVMALLAFPHQDIEKFIVIMNQKMVALYRWDLWAVGYIMQHGCSNDGFSQFRGWIISQGRETYESAIKSPAVLGDLVDKPRYIEFDDFDMAPQIAYSKKIGFETVFALADEKGSPAGAVWKDDDLLELYPALCAKFGFDECVRNGPCKMCCNRSM
jgi:hypothetical protein